MHGDRDGVILGQSTFARRAEMFREAERTRNKTFDFKMSQDKHKRHHDTTCTKNTLTSSASIVKIS